MEKKTTNQQIDRNTALLKHAEALDAHCQKTAFLSGVIDCMAVAQESNIHMTTEQWLGMVAFVKQIHEEANEIFSQMPELREATA